LIRKNEQIHSKTKNEVACQGEGQAVMFSYRLMIIILGSQRLIWGKADMRAKNIISEIRKGITPRKRSPVGTLKTVLTANKSIPIGGVMSPI
jgi:hypothetical protein